MRILLFVAFVFLFGHTQLAAQYESIPYKFSKFEGELPSGQKFYITGSLINMDSPPADVVSLTIYKVNRRTGEPDECPHYSGYYWKPADDESNQFKIFVDRPVLFDRNYKFEFNYYSSAQHTAGKNILSHFTAELDNYFAQNKSINEFDLIKILKLVNQKLKASNFGTLGFVNNNTCNGTLSFQFRDSIQTVSFPIKTKKGDISAAQLASMIGDRYLVKSGEGKIANAKEELKKFIEKSNTGELVSALENLLITNSSSAGFTLSDLAKLKSFIHENDFSENPFPSFSGLYSGDLLSKDMKVVLGTMDNRIKGIVNEGEKLQSIKAKVAAAQAKLGTFEDVLLKGYTLSGTSVSYNSIEFKETVETSATKATTPAGISGAFLNPNADRGPSEFDAFANAAVRTYFLPVDKRLPGKLAYLDRGRPFNRMSATFGVTVSPISYRGDELDAAIGVKPVFALGYDLTRHFSIDIGGVLFRQKQPDLLVNDEKVKFAPVFSIQFDANLFNRFKSLGDGQQFRLGTP